MKPQALSSDIYAKEWKPSKDENKSAWSKSGRLLAALACFLTAALTIWLVAEYFSFDSGRMRAGTGFVSIVLLFSGIRLIIGFFSNLYSCE